MSDSVSLQADITGAVLEIRITQVDPKGWRWLLCAIAEPFPNERHAAAWSGTSRSANDAFEAAMHARYSVLDGYEPQE